MIKRSRPGYKTFCLLLTALSFTCACDYVMTHETFWALFMLWLGMDWLFTFIDTED